MSKLRADKPKNPTCKWIRESLPEMIEGRVAGRRLSELESHLEFCEACRLEFEDIAQLLAKLDEPTIPEPGDAFWSKMQARVHEEIGRKQNRAIRISFPKLTAAPLFAVATILLFLALWWSLPDGRQYMQLQPYLSQIEMEAEESLAGLSLDHRIEQDLVEDLLDENTSPSFCTDELLANLNDAQLERLAERLEDLMG